MNRALLMPLAALALAQIFSPVRADESILYPAKGQSPEQQQRDIWECRSWAQSTTGVNPLESPQSAATQPAPTQGARARGALKGAAAGAVIGEIADDDAGKGAAIGATTGLMAGGAQRRQAARQQEDAANQAQAKRNEDLARFQRANNACLEGRGYTVK